LPNLRLLVIEPGKALSQHSQAVVSSVLSKQQCDDRVDVVLDASIAEIPQAWLFPHPILIHQNGVWKRLRRGDDRLLGRLCMEADILREDIAFPGTTGVGDAVVIAQSGAYDSSMAYGFGRG
jgi:diaminopimelate decarboxylase